MFFMKLLVVLALALSLSDEGAWNDSDGGGAMDPNGKPVTSSARCGDEGSGLDPHGRPCPKP